MDLNFLGTWQLANGLRILYLKAILPLWIKNLLKSMRTLAKALVCNALGSTQQYTLSLHLCEIGPSEGALPICI